MEKNNKALASMICGIVGLVLNTVGWCCCLGYVGLPVSIVAVVLGALSKKGYDSFDKKGLAGLIMGAIGIVLWIIMIILVVVMGITGNLMSA